MAFRLSMLLGVDADQAKAELGQTKQAIDKTKTAAKGLNTDGRAAAQGVNALGRAADGTEAQMLQLAEAERRAAEEARRAAEKTQGFGRSGKIAAGNMGNLVAQFNDIGVMMMAGQNPLQLAVQQGTQISQVIGPMGATGAVRALGSAFIGMLNPISLITIGSIAAAAAMSNWLFQSKDDAAGLEELLDRIYGQIDAIRENANLRSLSGIDEMRDRYGEVTAQLRALVEAREALARGDVEQEIAALIGGIQEARTPTLYQWATNFTLTGQQEAIRLARELEIPLAAAKDLRDAMIALQDVEGGDERAQALAEMRDLLVDASGGYGSLTDNARELLELINASQDAQQRFNAAADLSAQKNREFVLSLGGDMLASAREYLETRLREVDAADRLLSSLQQRERIASLTAQFGQDSLQVAEAQADADRAAAVEAIKAMDVSREKKEELLAALDAAMAIEATNMAATIAAGADEAARLASNLGIALTAAVSLANQQSSKEYSGRGGDPRDFEEGGNRAGYQNELGYTPVDKLIADFKKRAARNSGGGRASSTDREREAVERLLEREREQLEVMRETNPLQQEMIRNREILANATDGERAAIEEVIRARLSEQEALDQSRERMGFYRDMIDSAIMRSENLGDVLRNTLLPALWEAAMWGDGPLGSLFGGGSLLGMIFPGVDKKADGGYITGAGGVRDDRVPILGSAGEFMVNAQATARHRHLLEHLNSGGDLRRHADGGMIGGAGRGAASMGAGASGAQDVLRVELAEGLRASLLQESQQRTIQILDEYSRSTAPDIARAAMQDIRSQNK